MKEFIKSTFLSTVCALTLTGCYTNNLEEISVPADPGPGNVWQLDPAMSDTFDYWEKDEEFYSKWSDKIRWKGPGSTYFDKDHSYISKGNLVLTASRVPAEKAGKPRTEEGFTTVRRVYTGHIRSKDVVEYPAYVEARIKTSQLTLASNFWMLSPDSKTEIDITETYGDDPWTATRMATNYHIFPRTYDKKGHLVDYGHVQGHYETEGGSYFTKEYQRVGAYWKSPTHIEFYLNGKLVRTLTDKNDLKDPTGKFFDRGMKMIFDMEDHVWRASQNVTPTDKELLDGSMNKMYIDWVRVYKPVPAK